MVAPRPVGQPSPGTGDSKGADEYSLGSVAVACAVLMVISSMILVPNARVEIADRLAI